jgi:hypothetical protein
MAKLAMLNRGSEYWGYFLYERVIGEDRDVICADNYFAGAAT